MTVVFAFVVITGAGLLTTLSRPAGVGGGNVVTRLHLSFLNIFLDILDIQLKPVGDFCLI